ncbi:MAG: N-acetylmuramoyl-L-alanine amidase family protein [Mahellales bacterium]|jgi:N-acetylmuramoyl-L-alanine amidase
MASYTVWLDPGHGGSSQNYGVCSANGKRYREADAVLDIALKIRNNLSNYQDIEVKLTRDRDVTVSLQERANMINSYNKNRDRTIVISIHTNAASDSSARGCGTYHSIHSPKGKLGHKLATLIQEEITTGLNVPDRGIKTRKSTQGNYDYYFVIREFKPTSVLAELGFHTNPQECQMLISPSTRDLYAKHLSNAILRYFDIPMSQPVPPKGDVWKIIVDGTEIIALTGLDKARIYALTNFYPANIILQNTTTNKTISLKDEMNYEEEVIRILVNDQQKIALTGLLKAKNYAMSNFSGKIVLQHVATGTVLMEFEHHISPPDTPEDEEESDEEAEIDPIEYLVKLIIKLIYLIIDLFKKTDNKKADNGS